MPDTHEPTRSQQFAVAGGGMASVAVAVAVAGADAGAGTSVPGGPQRFPQEIWATLTEAQQLAVSAAIRKSAGNHLLALRSSLRLPGGRYYVAVFFGRERRNLGRLRKEGQLDAREVSFVYILLGAVVLLYGLIPLGLLLYFVKSMLGIDLFDGPSPIHTMLCG